MAITFSSQRASALPAGTCASKEGSAPCWSCPALLSAYLLRCSGLEVFLELCRALVQMMPLPSLPLEMRFDPVLFLARVWAKIHSFFL